MVQVKKSSFKCKNFLEFIVVKKGLDERFLPPSDLIIKELKGGKSKNSYKKERLKDDEILFLLDDLPKTEVGQSWKFAISLCFVFGLRAYLAFLNLTSLLICIIKTIIHIFAKKKFKECIIKPFNIFIARLLMCQLGKNH